jgi:uncharacterized damage-inducible protein DinB
MMPISDPLEILLITNRWATHKILDACVPLSTEQFHRRFEMGPGSLHDTTTHILGAMRIWIDRLAERPEVARIDMGGVKRTVVELRPLLDELSAELSEVAHKYPLDQTITVSRGGKTYTFVRGGALTHVLTHGTHHRAQCLNMLRHLGVSPLPPSSVVEWMRDGAPV